MKGLIARQHQTDSNMVEIINKTTLSLICVIHIDDFLISYSATAYERLALGEEIKIKIVEDV